MTKFRAWDKKNKSFITNDDEFKEYMIGLDGKFYRMDFYSGVSGHENGNLIWNELKDIILMQYTGLKDKNGKEICEGDIVRVNDDRDGDRTYEVIFEKGCYWGNCIYTPRPSTTPQKTLLCDLDYWEFQSKEIIGYIYENPELITGGKNG